MGKPWLGKMLLGTHHVTLAAGTKPQLKRSFHSPYRESPFQPLPDACGDGESLGGSNLMDPIKKAWVPTMRFCKAKTYSHHSF
jgi:hypothetical protein